MIVQYLTVHILVKAIEYDWADSPIFDITSFSFMNRSKPHIYSNAAWYNNYKITPNLMHLQWNNIFSYFTLFACFSVRPFILRNNKTEKLFKNW